MPKKNTVLSLKRREILELPGFELCHAYLYHELKDFVRTQMREYTKKKRGYTVEQYTADYNKDPKQFKPKYETKRKSVRREERDAATRKLINKVRQRRDAKRDIIKRTSEIHTPQQRGITWQEYEDKYLKK